MDVDQESEPGPSQRVMANGSTAPFSESMQRLKEVGVDRSHWA